MAGVFIAMVKYIDGYSSLGLQPMRVNLISYDSNLTIEKSGVHEPLFSVPWANLSSISRATLRKEGLSGIGSLLINLIPGFDLSDAADPWYKGVSITFWDEEIQRDQKVFFDTGSDRKSDDIKRKVYEQRDNYYRTLGKHSNLGRRNEY